MIEGEKKHLFALTSMEGGRLPKPRSGKKKKGKKRGVSRYFLHPSIGKTGFGLSVALGENDGALGKGKGEG